MNRKVGRNLRASLFSDSHRRLARRARPIVRIWIMVPMLACVLVYPFHAKLDSETSKEQKPLCERSGSNC